jgi:uncharacterized membrane protein YphA (DoxX/SURF4 family)
MKDIILGVFRIILSLVFLISGFSKVVDSNGFIGKMFEFGFGYFSYIAPLISAFEIFIGLSILFKYNVKQNLITGLILTLLFSVVYIYLNIFFGIDDCGCFGDFLTLTPLQALLKNGVIIFVFLFLLKNNIKPTNNNIVKISILLISAISFSLSGYTINNSLVSVFTFNNLEGKSISESKLSKISLFTKNRNFTIFVYSPTCDHCWNATANVKEINESKLFGDVIGVISTSKMDFLQDYEKSFTPNFKTVVVDKKTLLHTFGNGYPKLLIIRNGKIVKVYNTSEIPCVKILKSHLKII